MEPSSAAHRPQALIVAGLDVGQMLSRLSTFSKTLGLLRWAEAGSGPPPRPDLQATPPSEEAWRSYAVYSGALGLHHYKSSRRLP